MNTEKETDCRLPTLTYSDAHPPWKRTQDSGRAGAPLAPENVSDLDRRRHLHAIDSPGRRPCKTTSPEAPALHVQKRQPRNDQRLFPSPRGHFQRSARTTATTCNHNSVGAMFRRRWRQIVSKRRINVVPRLTVKQAAAYIPCRVGTLNKLQGDRWRSPLHQTCGSRPL
jgi:hypothetical protein